MSQIDWQAYDDGSLSPDQLRQAEALLDASPEARAELEGLRLFKRQLASLREADAVPLAKLERGLSRVTQRPNPWLYGGGAAVLVLLLALWRVWPHPVRLDTTPELGQTKVHSCSDAVAWAESKNGLSVGGLDPGRLASCTGIVVGKDWDAFRLDYFGEDMTLYVRKDDGALRPMAKFYECGAAFRKQEGGIGWSTNGREFLLTGQSNEEMVPAARRLYDQTAAWPPLK